MPHIVQQYIHNMPERKVITQHEATNSAEKRQNYSRREKKVGGMDGSQF